MTIQEKLEILSGAAKYDVSCASSGGDRPTPKGGFGSSHRNIQFRGRYTYFKGSVTQEMLMKLGEAQFLSGSIRRTR